MMDATRWRNRPKEGTRHDEKDGRVDVDGQILRGVAVGEKVGMVAGVAIAPLKIVWGWMDDEPSNKERTP